MTMRAVAFTLVELMVVVAIIVALLALLSPALDQAVESAERAVCAARLHAWGAATASYWVENKRKLMGSVRFGSTNPWPNIVWVGSAGKSGQFAVDPIEPYIQGVRDVGVDNGMPVVTLSGAWYCPSSQLTPEKNAYNTKRRERRKGDGTGDDAFVEAAELEYASGAIVAPFFIPDYTYYARIEQWSALATHPDQLTDDSLEPGRLLMCDSLVWFSDSLAWTYNHSPEGYSLYSPKLGGPNRTGTPAFSGVNRLMGDASVAWKPRESFDPRAMQAGTSDAPHTGTGGRNFY
jgi:type II secretory pathway pseudopilin PulG